jgi:hypothetical protein
LQSEKQKTGKKYFVLKVVLNSFCGSSSFGRARPCQGRGGRFEPGFPLIKTPGMGVFFWLVVWVEVKRYIKFIKYFKSESFIYFILLYILSKHIQQNNNTPAPVVKLVDTRDLKSRWQQCQ